MLTRGANGAIMSVAGHLRKGAGANGYIQRFIHFCNYALCYHYFGYET